MLKEETAEWLSVDPLALAECSAEREEGSAECEEGAEDTEADAEGIGKTAWSVASTQTVCVRVCSTINVVVAVMGMSRSSNSR